MQNNETKTPSHTLHTNNSKSIRDFYIHRKWTHGTPRRKPRKYAL